MRRQRILVALVLPILLLVGATGSTLGKAHVPAGEAQMAHRGTVKQLPAQALRGHLRHGDIQLPACDFNNVFHEGGDASNVISSDMSGVTYSDKGFVERDSAEGITSACPPGTF